MYSSINIVAEGSISAPIDYLTLEKHVAMPPTPLPTLFESFQKLMTMIYPIILLLLLAFFIAILIKALKDFMEKTGEEKRGKRGKVVA